MQVEIYKLLKSLITDAGFEDDIAWAENIGRCESAEEFAREHCFVVCNSGMRARTARGIFRKVQAALAEGRPLGEVFGHEHKCYSIQHVYDRREELFAELKVAEGGGDEAVLAFLRTLPHIGDKIKYHLAKNLGCLVAKPDRHLERIAAHYGTDTQSFCAALAAQAGDRITTVDTVIWRAASLGIIRYSGGVPLIPAWPFDRDEMEVNCPQCGQAARFNVRFYRREGSSHWPTLCDGCRCGFIIEPRADGLWLSGIEGYSEGVEPRLLAE